LIATANVDTEDGSGVELSMDKDLIVRGDFDILFGSGTIFVDDVDCWTLNCEDRVEAFWLAQHFED
jgi:pectin methylesterase-like acyl-CoA thioesterase